MIVKASQFGRFMNWTVGCSRPKLGQSPFLVFYNQRPVKLNLNCSPVIESRILVLCAFPGGRARRKQEVMRLVCREERYMRIANLGDIPLIFGLNTCCLPPQLCEPSPKPPFWLKMLQLGFCLLQSKESDLGFYKGKVPYLIPAAKKLPKAQLPGL